MWRSFNFPTKSSGEVQYQMIGDENDWPALLQHHLPRSAPMLTALASVTTADNVPKMQMLPLSHLFAPDHSVVILYANTKSQSLNAVAHTKVQHQLLIHSPNAIFILTGKLHVVAAPYLFKRYGTGPRTIPGNWEELRSRVWHTISPTERSKFIDSSFVSSQIGVQTKASSSKLSSQSNDLNIENAAMDNFCLVVFKTIEADCTVQSGKRILYKKKDDKWTHERVSFTE